MFFSGKYPLSGCYFALYVYLHSISQLFLIYQYFLYLLCTVQRNLLTGENIDGFDALLTIRQNFIPQYFRPTIRNMIVIFQL